MINIQVSYSRVSCYKQCQKQYQYRYIDKLKTFPSDDADNALIIGNTLHLALETNLDHAKKHYFSQYPVISDKHINEFMKLEILVPKVKYMLRGVNIYAQEFRISNSEFVGIVDLITMNADGSVDIFDFKYSNNVDRYMESAQLHIYKYYLENMGFRVNKMGFIFIPKWQGRQKKTETLFQYRQRLVEEVNKLKIQIVEVHYDYEKVKTFFDDIKTLTETTLFKKNVTPLCGWCDYKKLCIEGDDSVLLPENKRRNIELVSKKSLWIYGSPFSGKTTFANAFPNPIMLNTDGNIKFVDAPYIAIKDVVEVEGRLTKRTFAWEVFKDVISELEKKQNDFDTIIVDLLEDTYEYCRLYMYDKLNITHESDDSFRAWDKVRTEFLSTIKRLMNLDYENIILISHEDATKDITKKTGDKISTIKPNLSDKVANKVAGMVDIVARVVADEKERSLSFKSNEVVFGGGRLKVEENEIPLSYEELLRVYNDFSCKKEEELTTKKVRRKKED